MNEHNGADQQPHTQSGSTPPVDPETSHTVNPEHQTVAHDTAPLHSETPHPAVTPEMETPPLDEPESEPASATATTLSPTPTAPKRASGLMAGIAIGAIIGAIAGGATGSIVAANSNAQSSATPSTSQVTITNPESTTEVSAIAQVATPSSVTIDVTSRTGSGTGSGVIYSEDGYIITNAHVVTMEGASFAETTVRVVLSDGRILSGTIVGSDPYADIAVIKVEADNLVPIQVSDAEINVGDLTVAIGAPFNLSNTVTSGVVSTLNRGISVGSPLIPNDRSPQDEPEERNPYEFRFDSPGQSNNAGGQVTLPVIQTDASINPGNSGGPLLNAAGELIGINVAIASSGQEENQAGSVGLGFAIPVELATRVADSIIDGEPPTHGLLGATVLDARASEVATQRGGLIRDVIEGSAAEEAGLRSGDIITAVDGVLTGDGTTVSAMIRYYAGGTEVALTIVRDGETITTDVTLGTLTL